MPVRRIQKPAQSKRARIYGVKRVDHGRSHTRAWQVTITRQWRTFSGYFSDTAHGGKRAALEAAIAYRDRVIRDNPPLTRSEFAQVKRSNNRSGVPGVCKEAKRHSRKGKRYVQWYWMANWTPQLRGTHKRVAFSVKKYGQQGAFRRAVAARRKGLAEMEPGAHITRPGQVKRRGHGKVI